MNKGLMFAIIGAIILSAFAFAYDEICKDSDTIIGYEEVCTPRGCYIKPIYEQVCLSNYSSRLLSWKQDNPDKFDDYTRRCSKDNDCFITDKTICPCSSGGISIPVNGKGLEFWNEYTSYLGNGEDIMCLQVYNCFNTQPKCINHRCELV